MNFHERPDTAADVKAAVKPWTTAPRGLLYFCLAILIALAGLPLVSLITPLKVRLGERHLRLSALAFASELAGIPSPVGEVSMPRLLMGTEPRTGENISVYEYKNRWLKIGPVLFTLQTFRSDVPVP